VHQVSLERDRLCDERIDFGDQPLLEWALGSECEERTCSAQRAAEPAPTKSQRMRGEEDQKEATDRSRQTDEVVEKGEQ
jgi:hypothetical protein